MEMNLWVPWKAGNFLTKWLLASQEGIKLHGDSFSLVGSWLLVASSIWLPFQFRVMWLPISHPWFCCSVGMHLPFCDTIPGQTKEVTEPFLFLREGAGNQMWCSLAHLKDVFRDVQYCNVVYCCLVCQLLHCPLSLNVQQWLNKLYMLVQDSVSSCMLFNLYRAPSVIQYGQVSALHISCTYFTGLHMCVTLACKSVNWLIYLTHAPLPVNCMFCFPCTILLM